MAWIATILDGNMVGYVSLAGLGSTRYLLGAGSPHGSDVAGDLMR